MHNRQRHIRRARKGRDSAVNADRCAQGTKQSAAAMLIAYVPSERHSPFNLQPWPLHRVVFFSPFRSRRPRLDRFPPSSRSSPTLASFQTAVRNHLPPPFPRVVPLPFGVPQKTPRRSRITPVPSPSQRQRGLRRETPTEYPSLHGFSSSTF